MARSRCCYSMWGFLILGLIIAVVPNHWGCKKPDGDGPVLDLVVAIGNTENELRRADVVFVHGLDSDGTSAWTFDGKPEFYWPKELAKAHPEYGVWVVNYKAVPSDWLGETMPYPDRAINLLNALHQKGVGKKRVVFVSHSLGGIIAKQMLQYALTLSNPDWEELGKNTQGIVFIATPHTGADLASLIVALNKFYGLPRINVTAEELERNNPFLRGLNIWYRQNVKNFNYKTLVFAENGKFPVVGKLIVDQSSADPGVDDAIPIPDDRDHVAICKPKSLTDPVFTSVVEFLDKSITPLPIPDSIPFDEFASKLIAATQPLNNFDDFVKSYKNHRVTWEATIIAVYGDSKEHPAYRIQPSETAPEKPMIVDVSFFPKQRKEFDQKHAKDRIKFTGTIDKIKKMSVAPAVDLIDGQMLEEISGAKK